MESAKIQRGIPYAGLGVSLTLALVLGPRTAAYYAVVLGGSAAALLWLHWGPPIRGLDAERVGAVRGTVYYAGLLALIATLILTNPLFGFFGFTGYLHSVVLPGRAKLAGIAGTAAVMATTQMGGVQNIHGPGVYVYVGLFAVNLLIAGSMTLSGVAEQEHRHQLAEANERLREMLEENAGLHAQLVAQAREAGVLDERQRLAGEIHDTIAQGLTGIVRHLEVADRFDADPEKRRRAIGVARDLARDSLAEARRSVQALRPGPLATAQLPEALTDLAETWSRGSGLDARVEISGDAVTLPPAIEVVLFRAAQEALANAGKYSRASRVGVTLSYTPDIVVLDVVDDGEGFDPAALTPSTNGTGYGLSAMRTRLTQIGGTLTIESEPGDGTAISAAVPLPAATAG
ncbi:sensor histidine kinase [Catenulispora subtropica]|uniref:Oxygen sensor histidine kinase NreB n=1 Tax=Catenulispora subtropica TaxID=450798 RepID=A0ABP5BW80_9ACTN